MDPNHWSNYNQPYSRINHNSTMPSAHSSINRYELPLLDQGIGTAVSCLNRYDLPLLDQGLGTGLGALSPSLSPHTSLPPARGLGGIPQVNYGHPLHNSVTQFLDSMNLQSSFPSQSHYKPVPTSFPFDSAPRSSAEQPTCYSSGRYVTSSHSGVPAHSKSLFNQDFHSSKDLASSLTPSPMSPNPHVPEASSKSWSLSNFVPTSSNPFANLTNELSGPGNYAPASPSPQQHIPPPAHSTNRAISSLSQRSPYQPDPIYCSTSLPSSKSVPSPQLPPVYSRTTSQSTKPAHSPQLPSSYNMSNMNHEQQQPATPLSQPPTPRPSNYSSPQDLENMSGSQSPMYDPYSCISTKSYSVASSAPTYSSVNHMTSEMGYDPVSPTQPLSEQPSQQHQQGDSFCTVSLQDLASIGSSQDRMQDMKNRESVLLQETSHIMLHSTANKGVSPSLSDLQQTVQSITSRPQTIPAAHNMHNGQLSQSVHSPMQQSPISVGSPQAPIALGSPQTPLPSSTIVQAPPPVQAVADSTTKPKRGRGRKKKDIIYDKALELGQEHLFNEEPLNMTQGTANVFPNMAQVMSQQCHDTLPPQPLTEDTLSPTYQDHVEEQRLKVQNVSPVLDPSLSVVRLNDHHQDASPASMHQFSVRGNVESSQHGSDHVTNMHPPSVSGSIGSPQGVLSEDMPSTATPLSDRIEQPAAITDQYSDSLTPPTTTPDLPDIQNYGMRRLTESSYVNTMASQLGPNQMNLHQQDPMCQDSMTLSKQNASLQMQPPPSYMNFSQVSTPKDLVPASNSFEDLAMDKDGDAPEFDDLVDANTADTKRQLLSQEDETIGAAMATISADFSLSDKKQKRSRTKAEQKQMPTNVIAVTLQAEFDEEFQHLQDKVMLDGELLKKTENKSKKCFDAFQESYINFLQGKKTETLSSLSYSNITRRTHSTKYDPRFYNSILNNLPVGDFGTGYKRPLTTTTDLGSSKLNDTLSMNQSSTPFSDEENSINTVEDLFQNLCDNFESDNQMHRQSVEFGRGPRRGRGGRGSRGPRAKRARGRSRTFSGEREVMEFFDKGTSENDVEKPIVPVLPLRQTSSRKAKEKTLTRRKRKNELGSDSGSDTDHVAGMLFGLKSDSADSAENYDWQHEEWDLQKLNARVVLTLKKTPKLHSRSRGRGRKNFALNMLEPLLTEVPEEGENGTKNFEEHQFIIEKKDMENYDKFPVWKIEAGRLQKYELVNEDGKIRHRAVPTYRTWTAAWRKQFSPIKTKLISQGFNSEIVEVEDEYFPRPSYKNSEISEPCPQVKELSAQQPDLAPSPLVAKERSDSESEEEEDEEGDDDDDDEKRNSESSESESESDIEDAPVHNFEPGKFIIEVKDLSNYESYPIWKIENGKMLHKYELIIEDGKIRHRAVPTYSSWMPTLRQQFKPIRAKLISQGFNKEIVEVEEPFRPKPPNDGSLERQYEDDPLVESFNIYMRIFLSQALESNFLSIIIATNDQFFLKALQTIDSLIDMKVNEIDSKVQWNDKFKDCLKLKPVMRELDRPNLKQSCQACENASQPAIKSIHLYGQPYDLSNLGENSVDPEENANVAQEFMIGKTAAMYVGSYHSLYHFKYHIYERCLAKINIIKESGNYLDNSEVINQCLQNRAWILKLFEDLKTLLEKT
eukprot:XP_014781450.1 PREDICTED: uncharacterized protein LOC106877154 [Octopus bimaculoides]